MNNVLILAAVIVVTGVVAAWWRARDGAVRLVPDDRLSADELATLGAPRGVPVLLQFTAPGCVPCRASWQVLEDVSTRRDGVVLHAIDVADAPDVARRHGVLRAPTVFVIAADGRVTARASGVPDAGDLDAALAQAALAA
jgi:thiol-disulfide isomerase/thioredoxin